MVLVTVLWVVEINYTNSSGKDELAILLPSCAYTCIYVSSKVGKIIELFLFNIHLICLLSLFNSLIMDRAIGKWTTFYNTHTITHLDTCFRV